ncbi:Zn-ribbon domain-containing OB-fold protein [Nocardioides caldifontis]|uniref:Zn-ribbon domain-containing OB-fold protein n=1 Tax=Nocardioides caldifontis TaxID=2588938 RepID=UPI0011DFB29B|nr:zinc ribbon domain-containing protein [Nocardioides caldifontis]
MSDELFGPGEPGDPTYLKGSVCRACGRAEFPRRAECPACGAESEPVDLEGPARLRVSSAVLAQPPGSKVQAPYGVGVAEFPQGLCVIGLLVGEPAAGATVEVVVHEPYPGGRIFAFREPGFLPAVAI